MKDEVALYSKENGTGFITINRPELKNPLNMSVFRALDKILDQAVSDEEVRVLVVRGRAIRLSPGRI